MLPRRRPCGEAVNTLVDLNKLAGESPSFLLLLTLDIRLVKCRAALWCCKFAGIHTDLLVDEDFPTSTQKKNTNLVGNVRFTSQE